MVTDLQGTHNMDSVLPHLFPEPSAMARRLNKEESTHFLRSVKSNAWKLREEVNTFTAPNLAFTIALT